MQPPSSSCLVAGIVLLAATCLIPAKAGCPLAFQDKKQASSGGSGAEEFQLQTLLPSSQRYISRSLLQSTVPAPGIAPAPGTAGGCTLDVNSVTTTYAQCSVLDTSTGYDLYYTLQNQTSGSLLTVAISAESTGWVGIGFPQSGQEMVGTDSVIVKAATGTTTGATAEAYHMSAQAASGVQPPAQYLNVSSIEAEATSGRLEASFVLNLTGTLATQAQAGQLNVIYAVGPLDSSGNLEQHTLNAGTVLSPEALAVASTADSSDPTDTPQYKRRQAAHGWCAVVGLAFLIPLGISLAAFKQTAVWSWLFWAHVIIQILGLIVGIAGVALGGQLQVAGSLLRAHKGIGIAAVTAVGVQVILGLSWRPPPKSGKRWIFQSIHWWLGRAAACLAITNAYLGLHYENSGGNNLVHYMGGYTAALGVVFLLWLVPSLLRWRNMPIFIPSRRYPAGKNADYSDAPLGSKTKASNQAELQP